MRKPPSVRRKTLRQLVRNCYWEHRRRYGTRRIRADLQKAGVKIGRFQIRGLMKEEGLQAIQPKSFKPRTTDAKGVKAAPNLLPDLKIEQRGVGQVIIGDITYLPLKKGKFCYLAIWQDQVTRRIIGWRIAETMTAELVISALEKALRKDCVKAGAIIHSDRGSQYASKAFRFLLHTKSCRQSMSGRGHCYDNAQAESFFSRFKAELLEGAVFEDVEQAESEVFSYIEGYYNRVGLHSSLGYKSPLEFEATLTTKNNEGKESFCSIKT